MPAVKKASELLGFNAKVDLDEGILRTADYYRAQAAATEPATAGSAA